MSCQYMVFKESRRQTIVETANETSLLLDLAIVTIKYVSYKIQPLYTWIFWLTFFMLFSFPSDAETLYRDALHMEGFLFLRDSHMLKTHSNFFPDTCILQKEKNECSK